MEACSVNTIVCPRCHAALDVSSEICHQCGAATFQPAAAGTGTPLPRQASKESKEKGRLINKPWLIVVVMLHVGLLGIPMYWKTSYSLAVRLWLVVASIAYTVFAVVFIVWMGWWILRNLGIIST